jgi:hypothetical protein
MNAKARQNNTGRIHGANPRYIIDIFSLSGPSHWWRDPYLAKREGVGEERVVSTCMIIYRHVYYIQIYLLPKRRERSDTGVKKLDVC